MVRAMKNTPLASPERARPLAPVAVLMVLAVGAYALMAGCGGSTQESGTSNTGGTSTTEQTPAAQPPADTGAVAADPVAAGKVIYLARCALCHGPEGKGDGPAAAGLNPKPRNHTDGAYMHSRTDEQLLEVIRNGKGGMPAWKAVLSEQEIETVLKYVRTLAK
jgi:mono/diheme cytochrome c family protein